MVLDMVGLSVVGEKNPCPYITLSLLPKDVRFTSLIDHATYRPFITCCLRLWENIKLYLKLQ